MPTTVTLTGWKEFEAKAKNLPKVLQHEINGKVKEAADHWAGRAKQDAPIDDGHLVGLISTKKITEGDWEVISGASYSAYMEWGTKGRAKVPADLQNYASQFRGAGGGSGKGFYDTILEWVKRKGFAAERTKSGAVSKSISSTIAQEQAAFAIYLSIIRHGVRPHPFFFIQMPFVERGLFANVQNILNTPH